jgi:hypothetical protein
MKYLPILFTFLCMACVSSQKNIAFDPETYAASITAEELKAHLYEEKQVLKEKKWP